MSLKPLLLLSAQAGAGRSTLAANLAAVLSGNHEVWLFETLPAAASELALHRGQTPVPLQSPPRPAKGVVHTCIESPEALRLALAFLEPRQGWALVDGASLDQPQWRDWLAACGAAVLVERGDLQGCRRMLAGLHALEALHLPRASTAAVWMGVSPAQPLPELAGLSATALPLDARAWERLSQARLACLDEPSGAFAKALRQCAAGLDALQWTRGLQSGPAEARSGGTRPEEAQLLARLQEQLRDELDQAPPPGAAAATRQAWEARLRQGALARLAQENAEWLTPQARESLVRRLSQDMLGLGPLEDLLEDPSVSEVMVNRHDQVYVERGGRLSLSGLRFKDEPHLRTVIERIVWPLGRRIDESSPKVDARLPDGSRVNAIIPPLAVKGSCLTIRKFPEKRLNLDDLATRGALSRAAAAFLRTAVERKRNILVSGGTGSGKTTLLNALSAYIPEGERVITIEDSAELRLQQGHVVTLESRPANLEGQGEVSIRDLVINALRMRPDRIVVGECRGGEALDMLQAMNTGHEGSLTTLHANTSRDALQRLETLCLMSGMDLPLRVVRQQVASAIDLIVQVGRLRDGSRRVLTITEVTGMEGEVVSTQDLFSFRHAGMGADGVLAGQLAPTGIAAGFYRKLQEEGETMDFAVFQGA